MLCVYMSWFHSCQTQAKLEFFPHKRKWILRRVTLYEKSKNLRKNRDPRIRLRLNHLSRKSKKPLSKLGVFENYRDIDDNVFHKVRYIYNSIVPALDCNLEPYLRLYYISRSFILHSEMDCVGIDSLGTDYNRYGDSPVCQIILQY